MSRLDMSYTTQDALRMTNIVRRVLFHGLPESVFYKLMILKVGGGIQSVASDNHRVPGSCHGKVVTAQASVDLVSAVPVVSSLIELCALL